MGYYTYLHSGILYLVALRGYMKMDHKNNQEMNTEESNENMRTSAEDMESQYNNSTRSENRTSFCTHSNVTTPDRKDHLEGQDDKKAPSYSGTEEFRKKATGEQPFLTEGEETTTPVPVGTVRRTMPRSWRRRQLT